GIACHAMACAIAVQDSENHLAQCAIKKNGTAPAGREPCRVALLNRETLSRPGFVRCWRPHVADVALGTQLLDFIEQLRELLLDGIEPPVPVGIARHARLRTATEREGR